MHYLIYSTSENTALRVGALAPWDARTVVDVHLAEVSLLEQRTAPRRAYEIARHLVPAAPAEFFAAGGTVWEFARQAVSAAEPGARTTKGERITLRLDACRLTSVLEPLVAASDRLLIPSPDYYDDRPTAAVMLRHTYRVREDDAWKHVAAYVDLDRDPTRLCTSDELDENDTAIFCSVAEMVATMSATTELQSGDIVFSGAAESHRVPAIRGSSLLATA